MSATYCGDPYTASDEILGPCGRIINGAKREAPGQRVVWNANVCAKSYGKIWFGDLDLNDSHEKLVVLAGELGEDIYVLREGDARFVNERAPLYDRAVEVITA